MHSPFASPTALSAKKVKPSLAFKMALSFGLFQALMPMIGWLIGKAGESFISSVDHWVALILLCFIGGQMIVESVKVKKNLPATRGPRVKVFLLKL